MFSTFFPNAFFLWQLFVYAQKVNIQSTAEYMYMQAGWIHIKWNVLFIF